MKDAIKYYGWRVVVLLAMWLAFALASDAHAEWSAAGGSDTRSGYAEVRYDDKWWGAWLGANASSPRIGAELHATWRSLLIGGGVVLAKPDAAVGSALRYELRIEWMATDRLSFGVVHESNCRHICKNGGLSALPHATGDTANEGHNFFVLRVRW